MARVLACMWPGRECWAVFRPIYRQLRELGHETVILDFGQHYPCQDGDEQCTRLTLFDFDENSIPRLSGSRYRRLHGEGLDVTRCARFYHVVGKFPEEPSWLFDEGPYYQRLRMVAHRTTQVLNLYRPDVAIVGHGANPLPATVAEVCRQRGIPVSYFESPFVQGRCLVDSVGMHFFPGANRIDKFWPMIRDSVTELPVPSRIFEYLDEWRRTGQSKYPQVEDSEDVARVEAFVQASRESGRPVYFLPEQIPWDANIALGADRLSGWESFLSHVSAILPKGARILVKRHPKQRTMLNYASELGERCLVVEGVHVHRAITTTDATITFSSNAGFEALMLGKPVVCGGSPHFAHKGFTVDLTGTAADRDRLARLEPNENRTLFLHYADHLLFEYLLPTDEPAVLARRLSEATTLPLPENAYPLACARYLARIEEFSSLRRRNQNLAAVPIDRREVLLAHMAAWRPRAGRILEAGLGEPRPSDEGEWDAILLPGDLARAGDPELLLQEYWELVAPGGLLLVAERHPDLNQLENEDVSLPDPEEVAQALRKLPGCISSALAGVGASGSPQPDAWRPVYLACARKTGERGAE